MRVHVLYGQGGWVTSGGMTQLANQLRAKYPHGLVQVWNWSDVNPIVQAIVGHRDPMTILIGYSLGANSITQIADECTRFNVPDFPLLVAYDPSILSPIKINPGKNVKRLLLYHNVSPEPWGHLVFTGPQVEQTDTWTSHLRVCWRPDLHAKTIAAIDALQSPSGGRT